jgi:DNA-binding CsgD family transcriptional regulator
VPVFWTCPLVTLAKWARQTTGGAVGRISQVIVLERDPVLSELDEMLAEAAAGRGMVALVRGEPGIGKTTTVDAFVSRIGDSAHVLWGGCDDLVTARPLGPVWDMAVDEPDLDTIVRDGDRHQVFAALLELMSRALRPTVMVVEDIHWADDSTLDMVKFLGRRVGDTHGLLILTYRDGEVADDHPLHAAIGDLPMDSVRHISLEPLSRAAVVELAGTDLDGGSIWEISHGNPFFVAEMISFGDGSVPASIRDSVRARLLRLSEPARLLAELVSVVPGRVEISVLALAAGDLEGPATECETAGILEIKDDLIGFRHELARRAVESGLSVIKRRGLNRKILHALESLGMDVARCAHHAREAAAIEAMLRLVPAAARRAADLESHREALQQLQALEPYLDRLRPDQLADHYDLWALEEYVVATPRAFDIAKRAVALRREMKDPAALGNSLLLASRISWVDGDRPTAVDLATEAAAVLVPVGGEDLAFAYSSLSQLAMLRSDEAETIRYAERALEIAGPGPGRARAHALNNLGSIQANSRYPDGLDEITESYTMNGELGLSAEQTRAAVNLTWSALMWRDLDTATVWLQRGFEMAYERELPTFESYLIAERSMLEVERGDWASAEETASSLIGSRWGLHVSRIVGLATLGRVQTRVGSPGARDTVIRAWREAKVTGELQRMGPAGSVVAEFSWLREDLDMFDELSEIMGKSTGAGVDWLAGDIAIWLYLGGWIEELPEATPQPYILLADGKWEKAASFWQERGIPYEQALALSMGNEEAKIESLQILDRLGAVPLATRVRTDLAEAGVTGVPRGPQKKTRKSPLGLTSRQADVLELLADGMTNGEIAESLFLSTRTVDHHVSAILTKLNASSRSEAVDAARAAGAFSQP